MIVITNYSWEQRKVNQISNRYDNLRIPVSASKRIEGSTPYYGANGIQDYVEGFTHEGEFILVAEDGANDLKNYPVQYVNGRIWVNNHAHVLQSNENNSTLFLKYLINSADIESLLVGGGRAKLNAEILMNIDLIIPQVGEQNKIGAMLLKIENLITLHQRKYDKLTQIKKSLLEKMFPADGAKTPKIRFKGYTEAWEQRELGSLGFCKSGVGFPDAEQGGEIGIPFYKVSDMNTEGNERILIHSNNYVTDEQVSRNSWKLIEAPAIFFAKVGAAVLLNRKRLVLSDFLLDNNTMAYKIEPNKWDLNFIYSIFENLDLTALVQTGALPSYNANQVEELKVSIPKMDEQCKIGNLMFDIDKLITLHQRELNLLKNIKSSLLNKMFPA